MSENEVEILRRDLAGLGNKIESMHRENQASRDKDREVFNAALEKTQAAFAEAMNAQRNQFQLSINQTFAQYEVLRKQSEHNGTMLDIVAGDGKPGCGRLGELEETVEKLKQFRWQAIAGGTVALYILEKVFAHHG